MVDLITSKIRKKNLMKETEKLAERWENERRYLQNLH